MNPWARARASTTRRSRRRRSSPRRFRPGQDRVAGNLVERSAELEQELAQTEARLAGTVLGWLSQLVASNPTLVVVGGVVGVVLGAIAGWRAEPPHDGFPPAPPPRLP